MSDVFSMLFDGGRGVSLETGEFLFRTGDRIRSMYLVVDGQIDLVRHTNAGVRLILGRVVTGHVAAEASAYSDVYHCDGEASCPSRLQSIPVTAFRARLDENPGISKAWAAHLARSLQRARLQAEVRSLKTVAERLDAWLGDNRQLPPKGQWQDLAQILGVTREALYRELARRRSRTSGPA